MKTQAHHHFRGLSMKFKLTFLTEPYQGMTVDFDQDVVSAGRAAENDMVVEEPHVSGYHTRFVQRHGRVFIEDLGSTNGTFVNGKRVKTPVQLTDGDVLQFGTRTRVSYTPKGDLEDRTVVAAPSARSDDARPQAEPLSRPVRSIPLWAFLAVLGMGLLFVAISVILLVILL
jgi:pSer/pThr/pTyr-binding forkhead associated (FHA) protein